MTFIRLALIAVLAGLAVIAAPALAHDHVVTGAQNGKPGFGNSDPSCVPGQGDPNAGAERGTPASDTAVSCRQNADG